MYVFQLTFNCLEDIDINTAQQALSELLDSYRYNGQIIGREFPIALSNGVFTVSLVCPDKDAFAEKYNSEMINLQLTQVTRLGLSFPEIELKGLESQSDFVDLCEQPKGYVLYTTFVQSCSPVRCTEHFSPVPLYKLPEEVRYRLVKWQESYGACDQIQMNELSEVEQVLVSQLSQSDSMLMTEAKEIGDLITLQTGVPVYRYLYRVGGDSLEAEQSRACPNCGGDWQLPSPLHGLFDFKCESCLLVSNVSWDWQ